MQTFLPYHNFSDTAEVLDSRRLNKQIVECKQILLTNLCGPRQGFDPDYAKGWFAIRELSTIHYVKVRKTPWYNHPAVKMWRGHEAYLAYYALICCDVALARGIKVTLRPFFLSQTQNIPLASYPAFLGNEAFHASHRSNLKRKDPVHYAMFTEPPNLPYVWPVGKEEKE